DLLVMPSIWPEPFGLVGAEAARLGIPAAAFDVGGISEWLLDGVSGSLAPAEPPSASGLAHAIVRCLSDSATYLRLARGALDNSSRFDAEIHVAALLEVFQQAADGSPLARAKTA
ncbi:MAG TPA: glycosyltransferase, partial [Candidatus Binataceae bacterium]|nr:glycosyltransferase [Candidatus Binataceae bacterium]